MKGQFALKEKQPEIKHMESHQPPPRNNVSDLQYESEGQGFELHQEFESHQSLVGCFSPTRRLLRAWNAIDPN